MVKKGFYGNECFGLPWDCIKVPQTNLFITTSTHQNFFRDFKFEDLKTFQTPFILSLKHLEQNSNAKVVTSSYGTVACKQLYNNLF